MMIFNILVHLFPWHFFHSKYCFRLFKILLFFHIQNIFQVYSQQIKLEFSCIFSLSYLCKVNALVTVYT